MDLRVTMLLSHRIRLEPDAFQRSYFARAAGTARRVWNWALGEWNRQYAAGLKPNAMALKKQFNAVKYANSEWLDEEGKPWLKTMHRDSHAQPFEHLNRAFSRYFKQIRAKEKAHAPQFKKKNRCADSFYVANDKFRLDGASIVLPKVGKMALAESLRLSGKIMGATVQREADHWHVAVQLEVPDREFYRARTGDGVVGVDLGITAAAYLSTGESIVSPRPLKAALRRLRIRSRRSSRKREAAKKAAGIAGAIPKGTRLPKSNNEIKGAQGLARLHARVSAIRRDFTHKLTTRLCRENQAIVIEDLRVAGMLKNERLARHLSDIGFGRIRRELEYKARRYGCALVVADRWFPSSKLCSVCGVKNTTLVLSDRIWTCVCGAQHQRDHNAAMNLQRLAAGAAQCSENALPVASRGVTQCAGPGMSLGADGKVTPVRDEFGLEDGSGQEEDAAHLCARF